MWSVGTQRYNVTKKKNFNIRVALFLTINDFPTYSIMSSWSTTGKTSYPHCMEDSDSFRLSLSRKQSWFDNHRKFLSLNNEYRRNTKDFLRGKKVNKFFKGIKPGHNILRELNSIGLMKVTEVDA